MSDCRKRLKPNCKLTFKMRFDEETLRLLRTLQYYNNLSAREVITDGIHAQIGVATGDPDFDKAVAMEQASWLKYKERWKCNSKVKEVVK